MKGEFLLRECSFAASCLGRDYLGDIREHLGECDCCRAWFNFMYGIYYHNQGKNDGIIEQWFGIPSSCFSRDLNQDDFLREWHKLIFLKKKKLESLVSALKRRINLGFDDFLEFVVLLQRFFKTQKEFFEALREKDRAKKQRCLVVLKKVCQLLDEVLLFENNNNQDVLGKLFLILENLVL